MTLTFQHRVDVVIRLDPALLSRVDQLIALTGGMTKAETAAVTARLQGQAAKLEGAVAGASTYIPTSPDP